MVRVLWRRGVGRWLAGRASSDWRGVKVAFEKLGSKSVRLEVITIHAKFTISSDLVSLSTSCHHSRDRIASSIRLCSTCLHA
jgi:hypothetical protein